MYVKAHKQIQLCNTAANPVRPTCLDDFMICLHIDLRGISLPQNSSVVYPLEYQMSAQDTELMHLTAESTSADFGSLVTQAARRPPDRKIKTRKKEDAEA